MQRESTDGCFYVNTSSDWSNIDEKSLTIIDTYFKDLEMTFKGKLEYAIRYENYIYDPNLISKQLIVIIQGLSVYSKNLKETQDKKMTVEGFLQLLGI